jgi:C4-dicarboxylate transporter DctM subunit
LPPGAQGELGGDVLYQLPDPELLVKDLPRRDHSEGAAAIVAALTEVFKQFSVQAEVTGFTCGPTVTRYEVELGQAVKVEKVTGRERFRAFWDAKWSIFMPVVVLGGIYGGIFTPTEAAVIATVYGLIIGFFVYRELKVSDLLNIVVDSASTVGVCLILLGTAVLFGRVMVVERIPGYLADMITSFTDSRVVVLLLVNIVLLIAGMFLETLCAITICAPLLLAMVKPYGVTPLHFGVIICVNLAIGLTTPPVGASLYVAAGVAKIPIERAFKPLVPLLVVNLAALFLITYCEPLVSFLPALLGN